MSETTAIALSERAKPDARTDPDCGPAPPARIWDPFPLVPETDVPPSNGTAERSTLPSAVLGQLWVCR
jgi:hypothetical protein